MRLYPLSEFEEIVLVTVGVLYNDAYGVAIKKEIERHLKRSISLGALQTGLLRLESKGYITSRLEKGTEERGGRRKRCFTLTPYGRKALEKTLDQKFEELLQ